MSSQSNNQGRAFEFICLLRLKDAIGSFRKVEIIYNSSYEASKKAWDNIPFSQQKLLSLGANAFIDTLFSLEPKIIEEGNDLLNLYIQNDEHGEFADVRDIIIHRKDIVWEIGLSIKHNHMAVKHSRLSHILDFGSKWYGIKCSSTYWDSVKPVFSYLEEGKKKGLLFRNLPNKEEDIYAPLLKAFIEEIRSSIKKDSSVPRKLVQYLLSKYDFYKVISKEEKRVTILQAFNMYGTLNQATKNKKPILTPSIVNLPENLLFLDFKPKSKTTILMAFDNGWQFSFRIHNAKDVLEPSLKFDIQIIGMPMGLNIEYTCHWNANI